MQRRTSRMIGRMHRLLVFFPCLLSMAGFGQGLPSAEILTNDAEWCQLSNNVTVAEILISGEIDTSRFDLIMGIRGTRDTLVNLPSGIFKLYLNNQPGLNEYIVFKVMEYQESRILENDVYDTLSMEVHPWPVMTFQADMESPCSPATVVFRGKEGYPSYTWDFGDGTGTTTATSWVSHTYVSQEDVDEIRFETGLRVETAFGCVDSVTDQLTVYPTPDAGFQVSPELLHYPGTTVSITNTTTPGNWSFRWDFGDGTIDLSRDPGEHAYDSWGIYRIELLWFTPHCRDSIARQIEIRPPAPVAEFSADTSGCPPLPVSFVNNTLYADSFLWDFGDGTTSAAASPVHVFQQSGAHTVKLVATGISGTDSTEQTVTVYEKPEAGFEPGITETNLLDEEIRFENLTSGGISFLWDFGDGSTSNEVNPGHRYGQTGSYTVTLVAWNSEGCSDTLVRENLVTILPGEGRSTFPNAFRWNGSGPTGGHWIPGSEDNTVFHPDVENATALRMIILTRFGHKIFETNELFVGWDGYINESTLAGQGVYIYKAWITYSDGSEEEISGDVTFLH